MQDISEINNEHHQNMLGTIESLTKQVDELKVENSFLKAKNDEID